MRQQSLHQDTDAHGLETISSLASTALAPAPAPAPAPHEHTLTKDDVNQAIQKTVFALILFAVLSLIVIGSVDVFMQSISSGGYWWIFLIPGIICVFAIVLFFAPVFMNIFQYLFLLCCPRVCHSLIQDDAVEDLQIVELTRHVTISHDAENSVARERNDASV